MKTAKSEVEMYRKVEQYAREVLGKNHVIPVNCGVNYTFVAGDGPDIFIKLGENGTSFAIEKFVLEQWQKAGIPVPEVVHFDDSRAVFSSDVIVLQYVPHDVPADYDYAKIGVMLRRMHAVHGEGIGNIDTVAGRGVDLDWRAYLTDKIGRMKPVVESCIGRSIDAFLPTIGQKETTALLHLDFGAEHVLTRNGTIVAVIDPEGAYGDPLLDVAFTLFNLDKKYHRAFLQGYFPEGFSKYDTQRVNEYYTLATLRKLTTVVRHLQQTKGLHCFEKKRVYWALRKQKLLDALKNKIRLF